MLLRRLVNFAGVLHNPLPHGRECVMQASLVRIVHRQDGVLLQEQFRQARRKIACFLIYGDLPGLQRMQSCRLWCGSTAVHSLGSGLTGKFRKSVCQTRSHPDYNQLPSGAPRSFCIPCTEQGASGRTQGQLRLHGPDCRPQVGTAKHCRIRGRS